MDKYAAEKIAQSNYALGMELALEKVASGLLTGYAAKQLAKTLSGDIARAGAQVAKGQSSKAQQLRGLLPGSQVRQGQKILGGAAGKANQGYAESAHNLGYGLHRGRPQHMSPGTSTAGSARYAKGRDQGFIPGGHYMNWSNAERQAMGLGGRGNTQQMQMQKLDDLLYGKHGFRPNYPAATPRK